MGGSIHVTARQYLRRTHITNDHDGLVDEAHDQPGSPIFFAATRNPYERVVSLFYYKLDNCLKAEPDSKQETEKCRQQLIPPAKQLRPLRHNTTATIQLFHEWIGRADFSWPVGSDGNYKFSAPARAWTDATGSTPSSVCSADSAS